MDVVPGQDQAVRDEDGDVKARMRERLLSGRARERLLPWAPFLLFLLWGWQNWDLQTLPAYGDTLEVVWGLEWYYDSLVVNGQSPSYMPLVFHPEGWHTATFAHSPYLLIALLPLYAVGGGAFVYNVVALALLGIAFAGAYFAARLFVGRGPATLAALGYAFTFPLFVRLASHLNVLGGAALLPWMLWTLIRLNRGRITWGRLAGIGLLWGISINFSFYYIFIGGLLILLYLVTPTRERRPLRLPERLQRVAVHRPLVGEVLERAILGTSMAAFAVLFNLPYFVGFWRARTADSIPFFDIIHLQIWGISLNSIFSPAVGHPLLAPVARSIYTANINEAAFMSLGIVAPLLALYNLRFMHQDRQLAFLLVLMFVGIVLGLGVYLKWNEELVHLPILSPLNDLVWRIGYALKPALFLQDTPPDRLAEGIPLPELWLAAIVPFWEGVRTVARYAFLALLAVPLLAAVTLERCRWRKLRWLLAALWLVEILPPQLGNELPAPAPHPAHIWLEAQTLPPGKGIVDLRARWLLNAGSTILATGFHRKATASGVGSQLPGHTKFLDDWLREHGAADPPLASILRAFDVRYVLLHMQREAERDVLATLKNSTAYDLVNCFEPRPGLSPWMYPICVLEVLPRELPIDGVLESGWHAAEPWGVWANGESSKTRWVATTKSDHQLIVTAFPHCVPDARQSMQIAVNGRIVATHAWQACEEWSGQMAIPAEMVNIGWNEISFTYGYSAQPAEVTDGENPDVRNLSVGFAQLEVRQAK